MSRLEAIARSERPRLLATAYRMLGRVSEAEDVVQEALLRLDQQGLETIDRPGAWLQRVTARLCLDRLRAARREREQYVGPWLPEPWVADDDPQAAAELADEISTALLVVLESLSPAERVAIVLVDALGYDHASLALVLDRSQAACRQLLHRARQAVAARQPRYPVDRARQEAVADRFLRAAEGDDLDGLLAALAPDAQLLTDGGGKATAARRPVVGADRVARFVAGVARQLPSDAETTARTVNGVPGLIVRDADGTIDSVLTLSIVDDRVREVFVVRNPDKLAHLAGSSRADDERR